jgi:hypothetical protein
VVEGGTIMPKRQKKLAKMQAKKGKHISEVSQKTTNTAIEVRKIGSRYPQEQKQKQTKAFLRRIQNR